jgi:hypothetical protein
MTYNNDSHIRSVEDVKAFFHHLVDERKVSFHPDNMFEDYVSCELVRAMALVENGAGCADLIRREEIRKGYALAFEV